MRCRKLQTSSKPSFNVGFGTRPGGNLYTARAVAGIKALRAVGEARKRCFEFDWVIDWTSKLSWIVLHTAPTLMK
jgi:hypothetical protein